MPPDLRKASDLSGVVHARGEVDAPATGPRPVQFHLAAAAPLLGLRMRQFIDIRTAWLNGSNRNHRLNCPRAAIER